MSSEEWRTLRDADYQKAVFGITRVRLSPEDAHISTSVPRGVHNAVASAFRGSKRACMRACCEAYDVKRPGVRKVHCDKYGITIPDKYESGATVDNPLDIAVAVARYNPNAKIPEGGAEGANFGESSNAGASAATQHREVRAEGNKMAESARLASQLQREADLAAARGFGREAEMLVHGDLTQDEIFEMLQGEPGDSAPRSKKAKRPLDETEVLMDKLKAAKQPPNIRQPARPGASHARVSCLSGLTADNIIVFSSQISDSGRTTRRTCRTLCGSRPKETRGSRRRTRRPRGRPSRGI